MFGVTKLLGVSGIVVRDALVQVLIFNKAVLPVQRKSPLQIFRSLRGDVKQ
jgi:hypothetical protein